jgi:predicted NBD/HSP70 family sugar kinase
MARYSPGASAAVALLRVVHARPGITRVAAAQDLGMPSGFAAETITRLTAERLVAERPAPPTGIRGRPTTSLHPHPGGPLVVAAAIAHQTWQVAAVQLGGSTIESVRRAHRRSQSRVLGAVRAELGRFTQTYADRIRAVVVAVPGTVIGSRLMHAPNLGWHETDLSVLWPHYDLACAFLAGNDATFAAIAESRRGAATGAGTALHLYVDAGVGGAVIENGRVLRGATGTVGEFGHMPFGDPAQRCHCGATGCWNTSLSGGALARTLGQGAPADEVAYSRQVIAAARRGKASELTAIQGVARSLGRGAAGLVNAFDPHVVTIGGLGRDVLNVAGEQLTGPYLGGLMQFRASPPPPLVPAHFGDDGPLVGAAEDGFSAVLAGEILPPATFRTAGTQRGRPTAAPGAGRTS